MSMTGDHSGWRVDDEAHFQHDDQVSKVVLMHGTSCIRVGWYLMFLFFLEDSSCDLFNIAQESGTAERDKK